MRAGGIGRTYRFYEQEPLWAFGHGESYTTWSIEWAGQSSSTLVKASTTDGASAKDSNATDLVFRARVTNTGKLTGKKVVMAYVGGGPVPGAPLKSLFGVAKVSLKPGQSSVVSFDATANGAGCPLCTTDWAGITLVRQGDYQIIVGGTGAQDGGCPGAKPSCYVTRKVHLSGPSLEALAPTSYAAVTTVYV